MALEGTLRDFSLADIFQLIGLQRKTGVLTLRSPEDVVSISFLEGRVVGADSLNKRLEDRLGQVLLKTGAVPQEELDRALKGQMETLERLGHVLLRQGSISRDELRRALEQQILQIIFRVFRWQDGDYHFSQETSIDYDHELVTPMGAESILMEGARLLDEWPIIEKKIPHQGIVFVRTPAARHVEVVSEEELAEHEVLELDLEHTPPPPAAAGKVRVSRIEAETLELIDGLNTVEEIIRRSRTTEFETCKALYNLLTRSLIRETTRSEAPATPGTATIPRVIAPTALLHRIPWLALLLVPMLAISLLIVPKNPLNPLVSPVPRLGTRLAEACSWAKMWGVWQALFGRAALQGSFPDTLSELQRESFLSNDELQDPWGRPYRYVLREHSVVLAGWSPSGNPEPNLILSNHLGSDDESAAGAPGATLLPP